MKPIKNMVWKVSFRTANGNQDELETDGHIGKFIKDFVPFYCKAILKSPLVEIIERWQEPIKERK